MIDKPPPLPPRDQRQWLNRELAAEIAAEKQPAALALLMNGLCDLWDAHAALRRRSEDLYVSAELVRAFTRQFAELVKLWIPPEARKLLEEYRD